MSNPDEQTTSATGESKWPPSSERHMGVTPLDVRQARFGSAMRGFDKTEVSAFLADTAEAFDQALRENERLRQELVRLEASLAQFRELEGSLKNTLVSAQRVADDMRETAAKEAARIVREAEGTAALAEQKAHARLEELEREIDGLRLKRREAETSIEATISTLHNTLEFVRAQDHRDRDERQALRVGPSHVARSA